MIPVWSVSLSEEHCVKIAEWIKVLFRVEILGEAKHTGCGSGRQNPPMSSVGTLQLEFNAAFVKLLWPFVLTRHKTARINF